ncbi:uncharacterized protein Cipc isoform X2 [Drosophila suzukii]|uniref:Uncharacterized protein Cipc isoform X2 n=1 Tax=Drosophila suzukii TaxID=28584 RepID=A0ABM4TQB1_DROSZ
MAPTICSEKKQLRETRRHHGVATAAISSSSSSTAATTSSSSSSSTGSTSATAATQASSVLNYVLCSVSSVLVCHFLIAILYISYISYVGFDWRIFECTCPGAMGSHWVLHVLASGVLLLLMLPMLPHGRHASSGLCHNDLRQQLAPAALPPALAVG